MSTPHLIQRWSEVNAEVGGTLWVWILPGMVIGFVGALVQTSTTDTLGAGLVLSLVAFLVLTPMSHPLFGLLVGLLGMVGTSAAILVVTLVPYLKVGYVVMGAAIILMGWFLTYIFGDETRSHSPNPLSAH